MVGVRLVFSVRMCVCVCFFFLTFIIIFYMKVFKNLYTNVALLLALEHVCLFDGRLMRCTHTYIHSYIYKSTRLALGVSLVFLRDSRASCLGWLPMYPAADQATILLGGHAAAAFRARSFGFCLRRSESRLAFDCVNAFFFVFEIEVTWGAHARPQFRPLPCSPPADISKWHICMYVRLQIKVQEQQEIGANTLEEKN